MRPKKGLKVRVYQVGINVCSSAAVCAYTLVLLLLFVIVLCHLPPEVFLIQQYMKPLNTETIVLVFRGERASAFGRREFRDIFATPRDAIRGVLRTAVLTVSSFFVSHARTLLYTPGQYSSASLHL